MEKTSQIPITVGIPHNKIVQDLKFNSLNNHGSPLVKRPSTRRDDSTELASFSDNRSSSPLVYNINNVNNNNYVSGNTKIVSDLLTLLQTMNNPLPIEVIPNLMNRSASRHQLSNKGSVTDFLPLASVNALATTRSSDTTSQISKQYDALSLKSYTSVGMGSTDGKKMIVRKIPTSPVELFNLVNPPM